MLTRTATTRPGGSEHRPAPALVPAVDPRQVVVVPLLDQLLEVGDVAACSAKQCEQAHGAKALRAAVTRVFDHPVIQRCQLHKIRNVADKLPEQLASTVAKRMRGAYHAESALAAEARLDALAKELERTHPRAAGSLRGGMSETLTLCRLWPPLTVKLRLAVTLRSHTLTGCIHPAKHYDTQPRFGGGRYA